MPCNSLQCKAWDNQRLRVQAPGWNNTQGLEITEENVLLLLFSMTTANDYTFQSSRKKGK